MIKCKILRLAGHVTTIDEGRNALKISTVISAGNICLGRFRRRYNNIRINLLELSDKMRNLNYLAEDKVIGNPL